MRSAMKPFPQFFIPRFTRKINCGKYSSLLINLALFSVFRGQTPGISRAIFLVSAFCILHSAFSFDFGSASSTSIISHDFIVTNTASAPLNIGKVRPSCDCLQVLSWPRVIAPNTAGVINVRLLPDKLGPVAYRVFVEYVESSKFSETSAPLVFTLAGIITPPSPGGKPRQDSLLASVSPGLFTRAVTVRDPSCYISAFQMAALKPGTLSTTGGSAGGNREQIVVDVRSIESFNAVHIPGALNIPAHLIRAKSFLRSANVVLADNFGGDPALEQTCRDLRAKGFASVVILRGGLNAWRRAGGALEGEPAAGQNIAAMTPSDYSKVRDFSDWLVIYSGADFERASAFIPEVSSMSCEIGNRKSEIGNQSMLHILLVTDHGENYERLAAEFAGQDINVFYLAGGIAGYENYLRLASARPEKRSLRSASSGRDGVSPSVSRGNTRLGLSGAGAGNSGFRRKPCGGCS